MKISHLFHCNSSQRKIQMRFHNALISKLQHKNKNLFNLSLDGIYSLGVIPILLLLFHCLLASLLCGESSSNGTGLLFSQINWHVRLAGELLPKRLLCLLVCDCKNARNCFADNTNTCDFGSVATGCLLNA